MICAALLFSGTSLDPLSVEEHVAYYQLYQDREEGKHALHHAWKLLSEAGGIEIKSEENLPEVDLQSIIHLVTREPYDPSATLNAVQLDLLSKMSRLFPNRQLQGFYATTQEGVLALPSEEIDLARALLLYQFPPSTTLPEEILQYEATLDLMALMIRARLPTWASNLDKLHAVSRYIFEEKRFRFPPHSLYAKDVDIYTLLPSVIDSREGVCLGVSILYLCLAQRLGLSLEVITPPGHIYLRFGDLNIETTARGIHLPSETYLGVHTHTLQTRTIKEVIGLVFANQAAVAWGNEEYHTAIQLYQKARLFLPKDPLIQMLLGFNYLFIENKEAARALLAPLQSFCFNEAISPETIPSDYLNGLTNAEGIKVIFTHVDEQRSSILDKLQQLEKVRQNYPKFRACLLQIAVCHLQLGHTTKGLKILKEYHEIDPGDATVEYYLSLLYLERRDVKNAWKHCNIASQLTSLKGHHPDALREIRSALLRYSPEM
jgi:tetratricopeptide (TPR) repeat protein